MLVKQIQSIFLIVGTAVGAGILALPIATVECGFWGSIAALLITWLFMTYAAVNMLRARLVIQGEADFATMTTQLLGKSANTVVEFFFLALLFALISMYITVGAAWVVQLLECYGHITVSTQSAQIGFTLVMAGIIFSGLGNLANINQYITALKMICLVMLITFSLPSVQMEKLVAYSLQEIPSTLSMLVTTFGFSIILPSLASYMDFNRKRLLTSIAIGSAIILASYVLWELVAFGVIGADGNGLKMIASGQDKGTEVINALITIVKDPAIEKYSTGIMLTAVLTSFLGVGHTLFSYLKDVLPVASQSRKSISAIALGFIPPLLIINLYPAGISSILSLAGLFVAFITGIVPCALVLSKEYRNRGAQLSLWQKLLTLSSILYFAGIMIWELLQQVL